MSEEKPTSEERKKPQASIKPLSKEIKATIEKATVTLTKKMGRGFLVRGNLILTAAHCVDWTCDGRMAQGDFFLEEIETDKATFRLDTYAVEPCSDIAVLGEPDNQEPAFQKDCDLFETFCEDTIALELCTAEFELFKPFAIYVFTHERRWVEGLAQQCASNAHHLFINFNGPIKGGTSGSPIVNGHGEVVGIVSIAGGTMEEIAVAPSGPAPRPHLALPVWTVNNLARA